MFSIVVISLLSSVVAAHFGGGGPYWKSFRYSLNTTASTAEDVIDLVRQTLQNASSGITSDDLVDAAWRVKVAGISYLLANGSEKVPREDVRALIREVAAERNVTLTEYNRGFRRVQLRVGSIKDALTLWDALASRAQTLLEAGESPRVAIAAITKLAKAVSWIAFTTDGPITYNGENATNSTKRLVVHDALWRHPKPHKSVKPVSV